MSTVIVDKSSAHKVTLQLSDDLYATAQEAVALGLAPSQTAFIEEAIRLRAREVRHARLDKMAAEAMADPGFVADMRETMHAFRHVDQEHWPEPIALKDNPSEHGY